MKKVIIALGLAVLLLTTPLFAGTLVLSPGLKLTYPSGSSLGHTQRLLIFKYGDWYFSHTIVNPKEFYPAVDLTGIADDFIKAVFDSKGRTDLDQWLAVLAEEQAREFGVVDGAVYRKQIGDAELVAVFDQSSGRAQIFVFEPARIHHFQLHGSEKEYESLIQRIEAR